MLEVQGATRQKPTGKRRHVLAWCLALCIVVSVAPSMAIAQHRGLAPESQLADYPTFGYDPGRSGINPLERTLSTGSVGRLALLWKIQLPDAADSSAIELSSPPGLPGRRVIFVTTVRGTTMAVDEQTGRRLWSFEATRGQSLADYRITTATPAADPSRNWIYAASPDGRIHKLAVATGRESAGWPVTVTLHPQDEKLSSAINVYGQTLFVTTSGYVGDFGHYEGHLVAIDTRSRARQVFNTLCSQHTVLLAEQRRGPNYCTDIMSGVWARGGAIVDTGKGSPTQGQLFIATGNGPFNGRTNWGDSVLSLARSPKRITLRDSYTPANQADLNTNDADLGSTTPILLPKQPGRFPWLAVQGGKDNLLRVFNRANLSGLHGPGHIGGELAAVDMPRGGEMLTTGLAVVDRTLRTVVIVTNGNGVSALRVSSDRGKVSLRRLWSVSGEATSPVEANGVLYVAGNSSLRALDVRTGHVLWSSDSLAASRSIGTIHWQSPIVVNGMIIVPDADGSLYAYGLR
ncbi:MAG: PQQ-binding-like beta-propeller repeat protein [Chloroflexi bacterium]|nr:PQQ-binding-like beta-propeller repeat protein [Chloroflexota bacterium]